MSDTTLPSAGADGTKAAARKRSSATKEKTDTRTTDLEKHGREVEPFDALPSALKAPELINVGRPERIASLIGGGLLIAYGITRRDWAGLGLALTGGGLAFRGFTGHCPVYGAVNANSAAGDSRESNGIHVEEAITIDKSAEDLYGFWRDFENQALISDYLISVKVTGDTTSHWVAKGPANREVQWDAQVINERPNELIAWQTTPGSDIEHAGSVRFKPAPNGRGTEVHVTMQYYPPAGTIGAGVAKIMHRDPAMEVADTLKRLKRLMETGDIVKVDGQPHGPSLSRTVFNPKS